MNIFIHLQIIIMVNNDYTKISNKRGFLKLFGEKSDVVKKFLRTNKVQYP